MKKLILPFLVVCFLVFSSISAIGFSTHSTTISRTFDKEEAGAGDSITVTVRFTNNQADDVRGFYYSEQIPEGLSVNTDSVKINGNGISDYVFESGSSGEVYAGSIPYRWVLETPTDFAESNPVSQNSFVEIVYSVTSLQAGAFSFDEFNWVGYYQTASVGLKAAYGYSEDTDEQTVTFINETPQLSDADQDGVVDSLDNCPNDSTKTEPGTEGCFAETPTILPQFDVTAEPDPDVSITFPEVTSTGDVSATPTSNPSQPTSFIIVGDSTFDIYFTGGFTLPVTVCVSYDEVDAHNENNIKLYHWEDPSWQNITISLDTVANVVCGETMTFSPFAVGEPDADSDGLPDADEIIAGTNPNDPDSDGDGITDGWEVFYALDPLVNDANEDADGDGISNIDEINAGTNPTVSESATKVPIHQDLWLIPSLLIGLYILRRRILLSS